MLLVFVGQVTAASAITCNMVTQKDSSNMAMSENTHNMHSTASMDHSNHTMNSDRTMNSDSNSSGLLDCCEPGSKCSMGSCLSLQTLTSQSLSQQKITSQEVFQPVLASVKQIPNSLYRPPILS
jgi:hypothetical protein